MAYTTATLKSKDQPFADGRVRIIITFTGNAGEPSIDRDFILNAETTGLELRRWAINEAAGLLARKTIVDSLTIGQSINLTPIAPPVPTAREIWEGKANRLRRAKELGLTNATAVSELTTLEADVNATYVAGYI
jgi:hypothetical protein